MTATDMTKPALADLSSEHYDHILLDFDHTLFLDNSTERFLDALRPRLLAFLLVAASDWLVRALAWFGLCNYNAQRDFFRMLACTLLMPWYHVCWAKQASTLATTRLNKPLLDALSPERPVIILSFGFYHVIQPLLDAAGLHRTLLICSRTGPDFENLRRTGKVAALAKYAPDCDLKRALFITDSHDDDAVSEAVAEAHIVAWAPPTAPAFDGYYLPMRYTVEGKYADTRYFTYQILQEDFALLLLAYAFSPWYAFALWWLFLSLYAIYEIGYYENDHVAAPREDAPVVSAAARAFAAHPRFRPWIWATLCGMAGILLARQVWAHDATFLALTLRDFGGWLLALCGVRAAFFVFNRIRPVRRVAVFPFLHLLKTFSFVFVVPLTLVGALLLAAQTVSISMNYMVYRFGGNLERFNRQTWRLLVFLGLAAAALLVVPGDMLATSPVRFSLILVWCMVRAVERYHRKNLVRILADALMGKQT